jgi:hypothetical protein
LIPDNAVVLEVGAEGQAVVAATAAGQAVVGVVGRVEVGAEAAAAGQEVAAAVEPAAGRVVLAPAEARVR